MLMLMGYQQLANERLWDIQMAQRRKSQIRAEQNYDAKRPKRPIGCRLDDETMAAVDAKRGAKSRSAVVEELIRGWVASPPK